METFLASKFDEISRKSHTHNPHVRRLGLGGGLGNQIHFPHILVGADTGGFESFRRELLVLVRNHVDAQGEFVYIGTLSAQIEDTNLGVGDTAVETRFWIGLFSKVLMSVPL